MIKRQLSRLPRPLRIGLDWVFTIVAAVAIVLAIKSWVVNPYRIPSASMEPTFHCAQPASDCLSRFSDRVLANRLIYRIRDPKRGEIVVFHVPEIAKERCGAGGVFVKRIIGLPGEMLEEKHGYVYINGKKLDEPYIKAARRDVRNFHPIRIARDNYFMMGDNRVSSCDSRVWLTVPRKSLIGEIFGVYWPPDRIRIM
jgi:signal peptidase I